MFDKKNKIKRTEYGHPTGLLSRFTHHIVNDWPQATLVAAIVTILHLNHFGLVHVIDRYMYVIIGNLSTFLAPPFHADPRAESAPEVVVVGIGPDTHANQYLERAPLNRCVISEHLKQIYAAQPHLVVVDLDLSPVLEPASAAAQNIPGKNKISETDYGWETTTNCHEKLKTLIVKNSRIVRTVLLAPFQNKWSKEQENWVSDLEKACVYFASGELPIEYGIVLSYYDRPGTLARTAETLWKNEIPCDRALVSSPRSLDFSETKKQVLNFQASHRVVKEGIEIAKLLTAADEGADVAEPLKVDLRGKVVFFGARWGQDDQFLTPIDEMHGVDLHAMAFITAFNRVIEHESSFYNILKFLVDVAFGLTFSVIIASCWHRYFNLRLDVSSVRSQLEAPYWIVVLLAGVFVSMMVCTVLSLWLLSSFGIWASPVPIAIGMLFESFVSGSVAQAIQVGNESGGKPKMLHAGAGEGQSSVRVDGRASDCLSIEDRNICHSVQRFVYLDIQCLLHERQKKAALLLGVRRLIWFGLVGWAVCLIFFHH